MKRPISPSRSELHAVLLRFKATFLTVGAFSAIINVLLLAPSLYMLQVYDRVLASANELTLLMLTLMVLGLYLVTAALELIRSFILVRVGAAFDMALNVRIYGAASELNRVDPGASAGQALSDLATVRQFLTGNGIFAFFDAPWFPLYLTVIFLFQPALGWFALVGTLLLVVLAVINERVSRAPLAQANSLAAAAAVQATDNLRHADVIAAMGMLPALTALTARWFTLHAKFLHLQAQASEKAGLVGALTRFVQMALQSLVLGFGALLVIEGKMSAGMMIAASILVGRALAPVQQVIGVWKGVSAARSAWQRLAALLAAHPAPVAGMALPAPRGALALEAVSAAPPGASVPVLKNLSFALEAGVVLAVIGPSGAGKSTLARLLVGAWQAQGGKVRLDGADIAQWDKARLGPHIGYLPQDVALFAGTVSENIARFGGGDPAAVVLAAQRAGVHELILRLAQGYDTPLGDGGAGLSGGQRQRIGLARALYGEPALLVLDEPNASLDDAGERALAAAIGEARARQDRGADHPPQRPDRIGQPLAAAARRRGRTVRPHRASDGGAAASRRRGACGGAGVSGHLKQGLASDLFADDTAAATLHTDPSAYVRLGWAVVLGGLGAMLLWAALAPLDKGVPLSGSVARESNRKAIQHLSGGSVEQILVREGQAVKAASCWCA